MLNKKFNIAFVTGSRADYGKIKSIIKQVEKNKIFKSFVFVTGMHNMSIYGATFGEIKNDNIKNVFKYLNQNEYDSMDITLSKTILGFNNFLKKNKPNLIIVHGDRIESLACTIGGVLNNILVAHIEGGELSGTIDESIRHAISKLSNLHFVSNAKAKSRLIQMGEDKNKIFTIGSPDIDIIQRKKLPSISEVKKRYGFNFNQYAIALLHPVTTELDFLSKYTKNFLDSLNLSKFNYVIIHPNNDLGTQLIIKEYANHKKNKKFKFITSLRFEYYLSLLKHANFIIGNSSSGIIEAPCYGVPTINIGTRQNNRLNNAKSIYNTTFNKRKILEIITLFLKRKRFKKKFYFGRGGSDKKFLKIIKKKSFWMTNLQKKFNEIK